MVHVVLWHAQGDVSEVSEDDVVFRWKDYSDGSRQKLMTISAFEFLRRFLLHVLPKSFVRIRYYGFLANRCRKEKLELCRQLLTQPQPPEGEPSSHPLDDVSQPDLSRCPRCNRGRMLTVLTFLPGQVPECASPVEVYDTS